MGTLPRAAAAFPGETRFDLYAMLEPAREVGGDLYDFFILDADRLFFLIGDVSARACRAASSWRSARRSTRAPRCAAHGQVAVRCARPTRDFRDNAEGLFVTMLAGMLDARTGELEYCNAGHEPPLPPAARRPRAGASRAKAAARRSARVDRFTYTAARAGSTPGDTMCLVTDGITEAAGPEGQPYGREPLQALLERLGGARERRRGRRSDPSGGRRFTGGIEPSDDMAILVLRWKGR